MWLLNESYSENYTYTNCKAVLRMGIKIELFGWMSRNPVFDMQFPRLQYFHVWYMTCSNQKESFLWLIRNTNLENRRKCLLSQCGLIRFSITRIELLSPLRVQQLRKVAGWFQILRSLKWLITSRHSFNRSGNPVTVVNLEKLEVCKKICEDLQGSLLLLCWDWWACPCGCVAQILVVFNTTI